MNEALQLVGAALVCLALIDVYLTVLFARSGTGLLGPRINHGAWVCLRSISQLFPGARIWLLPHSGPLLLIFNMAVWSGLLVCGFALIVWPELGSAIQDSGSRATPRGFGTALYFAGYSLTTLGTGDLVPTTDVFRILMVLKAGLGFSFLTLTLTFFMSVYSALQRRNRFALMLHHGTADTGDAAELVARLLAGGGEPAARERLSQIEAGLDDLYESHHFYSILHYFYFPEPQYAMARILLVSMDAASLIRSALNESQYRLLIHSSAVEGLWSSGLYLLTNLGETFLPRSERPHAGATGEEIAQWKARYRKAVERLEASGLSTDPDLNTGLDSYIELRRQWNSEVVAFCRYMACEWREIATIADDRPHHQ